MITRRNSLAVAAGAVGGRTLLPTMPAATGHSVGSNVPPDHPDSELIRLCAEHVANHRAFNEDPEDAGDDNPRWLAYLRTKDAISEAKPQTIEGMVAKARTAKAQARCPDGSYDTESDPAARWAWDLVDDLLRLHAEASA